MTGVMTSEPTALLTISRPAFDFVCWVKDGALPLLDPLWRS